METILNFDEVKSLTQEYHMNIFGDERFYNTALVKGYELVFIKALGSNKEFLDAGSMISCYNIGYDHPKFREYKLEDDELEHSTNLFWIEPQAYYMKLIGEMIKKKGIMKNPKFAFGNDGTWANETLLKAFSLNPGARMAAFKDSFHGRNGLALSATYHYRDKFDKTSYPLVDFLGFNNISDVDKITEDTFVLIMEVVQGESGINKIDKDVVKEIARQCSDTNTPIIIDEVQTGVGRTSEKNEWFAIEHYLKELKVKGKSQVKGIACGKSVANGFPMSYAITEGDLFENKDHANTYGGNHMGSTRGIGVHNIIHEDGLLRNSGKIGKLLKEGLGDIKSKRIKEVRGLGLMIGIEMEKEGDAVKLIQESLKMGVIVLPTGKNVVRLEPPLVYTEENATQLTDTIKKAIKIL